MRRSAPPTTPNRTTGTPASCSASNKGRDVVGRHDEATRELREQLRVTLEFLDLCAQGRHRDHLGQGDGEAAGAHVVDGGHVTRQSRADRGDLPGHEIDRGGERLGVEVLARGHPVVRDASPNATLRGGMGSASSRDGCRRARCRRPRATPNRAAARRVSRSPRVDRRRVSDRCRVHRSRCRARRCRR